MSPVWQAERTELVLTVLAQGQVQPTHEGQATAAYFQSCLGIIILPCVVPELALHRAAGWVVLPQLVAFFTL